MSALHALDVAAADRNPVIACKNKVVFQLARKEKIH